MWIRSSLLALLLSAAVTLTAAPAGAGAAPRTGYDVLEGACGGPPAPGHAMCFAVAARPVPAPRSGRARLPAGARPYTAAAGALAAGPAGGLTPADLAGAYSYDPSGGAGQTVAVVDAFDDPHIEADLGKFDRQYGLGECTTANGCFRKVNQLGREGEPPPADTTGWSTEISLDVETVRAACHACSIILVEAASDRYEDLAKAVNEAVALGAGVVTNSYGGPEAGMGATAREAYDHPGVVIAAASGDVGWDDFAYWLPPYKTTPPGMPNAPASLPSVVAVGGTTLHLDAEGAWRGETVWDDETASEGRLVTGGGCSTLFAAPPWQAATAGFPAAGCAGSRLSADVAADGDPLSGLDVYDSFDYCLLSGAKCSEARSKAFIEHEGWQKFGGTSLSAPLVGALYALAGGSHGVAYPALALYGHLGEAGALHDVTFGGSGICDGEPASVCKHPSLEVGLPLDCEETAACDATIGIDGPSGVGTPNGLAAFSAPSPSAVPALGSGAVAGAPARVSATATDPNPGAVPAIYEWSWGDGTPPTRTANASVEHVFAAAGTYQVTLTMTDSYGLKSPVAGAPIAVSSPAPAPVPISTGGLGVSAFTAVSPPRAALAATALTVSRSGRVTLRISCVSLGPECAGTVTIRSLGALAAARRSRRSGTVLLATGSFRIAAGHIASVVLHLTHAALAALARHPLRARVVLRTRETGGAPATAAQVATLRPAPPRGARRGR